MKIKKVEIQAFRAYDKVEDGTFDFTSDKGKVANFVTLYAPNGFGKTSFYDAVEWGVTNNISRFLRKKTENENAAKAEKNKYIWRHNNSSEDTPSFVKISTDDSDKTFYRSLCHKLKSNQRDAKFDEKLTEDNNRYFLDVMLSQEQISAFLKEDDASLRYEKFTDTFGDKKIDQNYKHISELVNLNKKNIKKLKDRTKELKVLLNQDVDRDILKTINSMINEVNKSGSNLPNINFSYSDKDDSKIKIEIINLLNTYQSEINSLNDTINKIDDFISNENKELIVKFDKYNIQIKSIDEQINKHKVYLSDLNKKKSKERRIYSEKLDLEELKELREKFLDLSINIQEIEYIKESLTKLRQEVESLNTQQKSIQLEFDKVKRLTREAQIKSDSLETVKHELIYRLENASLEYKLNDSRLKELEQLTKNIENKKRDVETKKQEKLKLDELITITKQRANELKSNKFNNKLVDLYPEITDEFTLVVESFEKSSDFKKTLDSLELELEESQALDTDIKNLVKSGTNLISRNSLSSCPLCSNEYSDFKELLNAIESNLLFDVKLKALVAHKNSIELSYIEEREKFLLAKKSILAFLYDLIDTCEISTSKIESLRIEIIQEKHNSEAKLKSIQSVINTFTRETESKKLSDYEDYLNEQIDKVEFDIAALRLTISKNKVSESTITSQSNVNKANMDSFLEDIRNISKDPLLLHAQELIGSTDIGKISKSSIVEMSKNIASDLSKKEIEIDNLHNEIKEIDLKHAKFELTDVENEIEELKNTKSQISNKIKFIRYFIEQDLKIEINNKNSEHLFSLILEKKKIIRC